MILEPHDILYKKSLQKESWAHSAYSIKYYFDSFSWDSIIKGQDISAALSFQKVKAYRWLYIVLLAMSSIFNVVILCYTCSLSQLRSNNYSTHKIWTHIHLIGVDFSHNYIIIIIIWVAWMFKQITVPSVPANESISRSVTFFDTPKSQSNRRGGSAAVKRQFPGFRSLYESVVNKTLC